ncbi:MAG: TonB-dependent receptor [Rhodothermales bacterium]|nr:TonB-dependent receptor [Rhodothermales bacterium]
MLHNLQNILVILTIATLVAVMPSSGQSSRLSGTVTTVDGEALVGAELALVRDGSETPFARDVADLEGRFEFRQLPPGTYGLVAQFVGFADGREAVVIESGSAVTVDIQLESTGLLLDPIVITASRRPDKTLDAPSSVSLVSSRDLERDAVPSIASSLRNVPGVDLQQQGINQYYLSFRGFNDNYISRVHPLLDFRDMHGPGFSDAFYVMMPMQALDLARIEIVRGPSSALYGAGVDQGVVHFITKDPFAYQGTSLLLEGGEQETLRGGIRHAGAVNDRLGYKVVGSYFRGEDWKFDPDNSHDAEILGAIAENRIDSDGNAKPLGRRIYGTYAWYVGGEARYRFGKRAELTGNTYFSGVKNSFNASGEWQWSPSRTASAQLRLRSGRFFTQMFYSAIVPGGDSFNYRTGLPAANESAEAGWQIQYGLDLLDGRQDFVGGLDVQRAVPRTGGSLTGRNEEDDDFAFVGAYLQSETRLAPAVDVTLSGRADYFTATRQLGFSPRSAIVFKVAPAHRVRVSYNRALGLQRGLAYFMDFITDDPGPFVVRLRGAATPYTFSDSPVTSSFIGIPGFSGQDPGVGIDLARAYAAATAGLTGPDGPLNSAPPELVELLMSRTGSIDGFSAGILLLNDQVVDSPTDRGRIKPTITNTFEIGYQGLLWNRVHLGVDGYYTRKNRFHGFQVITPMVLVPGLAQDMRNAVRQAFADEDLTAFDLSVAALEEMYGAAGAEISEGPVGLIEPEENFDADTRPELLLINGNFGKLDYFGVDLWLEASLTDRLSGFLNTSWISENYFDDDALNEPGSGAAVAMNAPQNKLKMGLAYGKPESFNANLSFRYVRSFDVLDDEYTGTVDRYAILDMGAGYDLSRYVPGLRVDVTAQNALDNRHREYIGVPMVGRLVTARLTYHVR